MTILKWDRKFAMEQTADDEELLQELLGIFKTSSAADFQAIEKGLLAGDTQMICAAAHSIKGAAASLGVEGLREIALAIESDSSTGSLHVAQKRVAELERLLQELQRL